VATRVGQEARALVVQDAKKTSEKEIITAINTGVTKGKRASERLRVEESPYPRWYRAQVLFSEQLARQLPDVA
jgi:hypothetical protein